MYPRASYPDMTDVTTLGTRVLYPDVVAPTDTPLKTGAPRSDRLSTDRSSSRSSSSSPVVVRGSAGSALKGRSNPGKHVLDHAGCASPTRRHELCTVGHKISGIHYLSFSKYLDPNVRMDDLDHYPSEVCHAKGNRGATATHVTVSGRGAPASTPFA